MLHLLLALVPLFSADDKPPPAPEIARAKAVISELDRAFREGDKTERLKAIEAATGMQDDTVIERAAKGLRDKELEVQRATVELLRYASHPDATKFLVEAARREAHTKKDADLSMALWRAIGQHADPAALDVLAQDLWNTPEYPVLQARVLSLGRIRTRASLEKLFEIMKAAGTYKLQPHMETFRLALMVLTGVDQGASPDAWLGWWNENRTRADIAAKPAPLPKSIQYAWDRYWGEAQGTDRQKRRTERGRDDPEKRPGSR